MKFIVITLIATSFMVSVPVLAQDEEKSPWSSESEVGILLTGGNSEVETYNAATDNKYTWSKNLIGFGGHYVNGKSGNVRSAENWSAKLRYERIFTERLSVFLAETVEGDRFSGYDTRYNTDLGAKYIYYKGSRSSAFFEAGYRYTVEENVDPLVPYLHESKGRLYHEYQAKIGESTDFKLWVEYIPNFSDSDDWLLTYEPSVSVKMSKVFSLKTAYKGIYDNEPATVGNKKHDYTFTTSLVAKF